MTNARSWLVIGAAYATPMSADLSEIRVSIESLRNVGLVSKEFDSDGAADEWRAAMRGACRAEHLRIRTFKALVPANDGSVSLRAFVQHMDHVVTDEERQANQAAHDWTMSAIFGRRRNIFMEITRRDDIGTDLKAPSTARGGVPTPGYSLVSEVLPGDVVIHYDSRQEAIVGVSVVTGPSESAPIYWVARGTYARRAGERARWLPGIRVPLGGYSELAPPLRLIDIQAKKDQVLALRARVQEHANGQSIYFPWIPYRDTLRTFQSYLARVPDGIMVLFPQLNEALRKSPDFPFSGHSVSPLEEQVETAVNRAAGKMVRRARGQGFQLDQEVKAAVEAHAMNAATEFYATSWAVEDVHGKESYDLVCRRNGEVKHVEVKGTTTDGVEVILTPNEVTHARDYAHTALFVLSGVTIERPEDGPVTAMGGVSRIYDPWEIGAGTLTPIGYRYQVPPLPNEPD